MATTGEDESTTSQTKSALTLLTPNATDPEGIKGGHALEEGVEFVGTALYRQRPGIEQCEIGGDLRYYPRMRFMSGVRQPHVASHSASASVDALHRVTQQVGHRSAMDDGDRRPHECRHRLVVADERGEGHVPFIDVENDVGGHEP